jgi:hypothetical protein
MTKDPLAKIAAVQRSIEAARKLQRLRRTYGLDRINLLVDDVEGDWLEQWQNQ